MDLGLGFGTWIWDLDLGLDLGLTIFPLKSKVMRFMVVCARNALILVD